MTLTTVVTATFTRRMVSDQEHRLLQQRAGEATAILTNVVIQVQNSTRSLAAVVAATGGDPSAFRRASAGGAPDGAAALVAQRSGRFEVVVVEGGGSSSLQGLPSEAIDAFERATRTGELVATSVIVSGEERRIGFAQRAGAAGDALLVYREFVLSEPGQRRRLTASEPFSDLEAVLYAGPVPDPDQVVLATTRLPIPGRTVARAAEVGADRWLLEVAANRPLVGSMAKNGPWMLLGWGLLGTVLLTAFVEVLVRRRSDTAALVEQRTEELAKDRERLAEAQRISHLGSWEWDLGSGALTWSEELHGIFGVERTRFTPSYDEYLARVHEDDRELVRVAVANTRQTGLPFAFDHRILRPDGTLRWVSCEGRIEYGTDGQPVRMRGTAQDITDRRRVEDQFRDLLEAAPDGVVIVDSDGRITLVNRQTEALFGWPREELVGQPVEMLLPDRFRDRHTAHRTGYSADPLLRPMGAGLDLYARRADGSEFPVEISLSPLRTDDGVLISAAVRDVSERKRTQEALAHQALHDALTGLPNRVLLADRLEQALERSVRTGGGVAVLFVDLDRFKVINDSRGHAAGDELLVSVARRLRAVVRSHDTVARFGGDEFVVVCEEGSASLEASALAERVTDVLRDPVVADGQEIFVSASVGVVVAEPGDSAENLLRDADAAMYRAKERGRARHEFFDGTMRTEAVTRLEMQNALHRAIERDELRLLYQPVVELSSGAITGVEALVRWAHPELGLVPPGTFIPLAEETGLIVPIGRWVLEEAISQLSRWHDHLGPRRLTMNVNLSARQLRQSDLVESVEALAISHGVGPGALCLELTESAFMADIDHHRETLSALTALGMKLALDDFGTGYSSLTYLKRFPVDILKIDQVFVRGLGSDGFDSAIVRSVIELAHALGLVVVAEGVETAEQVEHLRALGCDSAQGYFYARPQTADDMTSLLSRDHSAPPPYAAVTAAAPARSA